MIKKKGKPKIGKDGRIARSTRLPPDLWTAIDEDAKRCHRKSSNEHVQALLGTYYGLENVELKDMKDTRKQMAADVRAKEQKQNLQQNR